MKGIAAVIRKNEKYLMIQQSKDPYRGYWGIVHGSVEPSDKSEEDAVKREVREELGIEINIPEKIATTYVNNIETGWWLAEYQSGEIRVDKSEISECRELPLSKIFNLRLFPPTKEFFQKYKQLL